VSRSSRVVMSPYLQPSNAVLPKRQDARVYVWYRLSSAPTFASRVCICLEVNSAERKYSDEEVTQHNLTSSCLVMFHTVFGTCNTGYLTFIVNSEEVTA